ncbi:MAG: RNA methyltransferase [Planctomycetota bacterium]|nr:MAG: RNA methyltransferase [Planctomycetota bacterium]
MRRVEDPEHPALAPFRLLRQRARRLGSWVLAEGEFAVRRLLDSDFETVALLATEAKAARLARPGLSVWVGDRAAIEAVVGYPLHRGCVAAARRPAPRLPDAGSLAAGPGGVVLAVERSADPSNLGALLRLARAFGALGVLCDARGADPYEPRAVRAGMGNQFARPPWVGDVVEGVSALRGVGFRVLAATARAPATSVAELPSAPRSVLLVGNEGEGLSAELMALADVRVTVPLAPGADSLNVACAAAVLLYALREG